MKEDKLQSLDDFLIEECEKGIKANYKKDDEAYAFYILTYSALKQKYSKRDDYK